MGPATRPWTAGRAAKILASAAALRGGARGAAAGCMLWRDRAVSVVARWVAPTVAGIAVWAVGGGGPVRWPRGAGGGAMVVAGAAALRWSAFLVAGGGIRKCLG